MSMTADAPYAVAGDNVTALWTRRQSAQPQRHPSRRTPTYRPRGSRPAAPLDGGLWLARTQAAQRRKSVRGTANLMFAILPVVALIAGFAAFAPMSDVPAGVPTLAPTMATPNIGSASLPVIALPETLPQAARQPAAVAFDLPLEIPAIIGTGSSTPQVLSQVAALSAPGMAGREINVPTASSAVEVSVAPQILAVPATDEPPVCASCGAPFPSLSDVTLAVMAADPSDLRAASLLASITGEQPAIAALPIPLKQSAVRFYRPEDAGPAAALAAIYDAALVDLTWFAPDAAPARIEVMLAPET